MHDFEAFVGAEIGCRGGDGHTGGCAGEGGGRLIGGGKDTSHPASCRRVLYRWVSQTRMTATQTTIYYF